MKSDLFIVKDFITKLKNMTSSGQDSYPFWYLFKDEFHALDNIIRKYEEMLCDMI